MTVSIAVRSGVVLLALCVPLLAQRAQLPIKGRQPDRTPARDLKAIRTLPRGKADTGELVLPIETLISNLEPRPNPPVSADRSRPLMRSVLIAAAPSPLPVVPPSDRDYLPRVPEGDIAAMIPVFVRPTQTAEETPVKNRWTIARFEFPMHQRYENNSLDVVYAKQRWWDPFNRNVVKGDYPIAGRHQFLAITGASDTLVETRRVPVPIVASAARPGEPEFFGRGEQYAIRESFRLSFDLFRGSAGFKPVDYEIRITPEFNINRAIVAENALVRVDVRQGTHRTDTNIGMQEMFFEKRFGTNSTSALRKSKGPDDRGSAYYDFTSLRMGIQRFTSDFRGFIFSDEQPGARLFGTFKNNLYQYNLAYFNMLEKDTNSGLNRWRQRHQSVYIANLYRNDFLTPGYNMNFSLLYNNDQPDFLIDKNGFLVRPAPIGLPRPHKVRAGYAGIAGDGHIKRFNISHAFYQAFGSDDENPIPPAVPTGFGPNGPIGIKRRQHINAQLAALELAYERDWAIYKVSAFFASGDGDIRDGVGKGFDAIVPNQQFAGGGFLGSQALADRGLINNAFEGGGTNFLNRQFVPLTGTGVLLFGPNSLLPSMRAGAFEGQANFINPGVLLFNAGMDAKITPKLRSTINVNYVRFHRTEPMQALLFQSSLHKSIGVDSGFGLQYRPLLSENVVFTGGFGVLAPARGFKDIFTGRTLFSGFINLRILF